MHEVITMLPMLIKGSLEVATAITAIKGMVGGDSELFHQLVRELYTEIDRNLEIFGRMTLESFPKDDDHEALLVACSFIQTTKHAQLLFALQTIESSDKDTLKTQLSTRGPDARAEEDDDTEPKYVTRTIDNALNYVIIKSDAVRQLAAMRQAGVSLKPVQWTRRLRGIQEQELKLLEALKKHPSLKDLDWRQPALPMA